MDRVYNLVHQLIEYYPYFNSMYSSTNFSYDSWLDQFMGLMNCFAQYPYRQFNYLLQLSVDGPPELNDSNRGEGVSQRCIENFDKLIQLIKDGKFPENVKLECAIKGTWDVDCIQKLNSKEKLIEFYQYYENAYIDKVKQLNNPNITMGCSIPNTAVPAPVTKQDGINFANLVKLCREIEQENIVEKYFKYYQCITPYSAWEFNNIENTLCGVCSRCGTGYNMVGFLPHNMVSACHEGFTLLAEKYKEFAKNRSEENLTVTLNKFFELTETPLCLTDDQYIEHERKMSYISCDTPTQISNSILLIIALAMSGLIDKKYVNEYKATLAAKYILQNTSFCIKANYATTGSFVLEPVGEYVLLLNGALDYLLITNGKWCNATDECSNDL